MNSTPEARPQLAVAIVRRTVLVVAAINAVYFGVEAAVALAIGSVALLADSVDFLHDAAVNLLIALALGWSLAARARVGRLLALVILVPAVAVVVQAVVKIGDPTPPSVVPLVVTAAGAALANLVAALLLTRIRSVGGSMVGAAWYIARNDVVINLAIIVMALVTLWASSGWPDIALGALIVALNGRAAVVVWRLASEESLAARALAGEKRDDD